jgi:predicted RNA-binding Zn-ribbon protein involved in translation (DUF1610 family)
MAIDQTDLSLSLVLDGNAAAGILNEIFALEMTTSPFECASCGHENEMGALLAFMQAPGIVLRCPACGNIILRIVQTPGGFYLDLRGAAYLYLKHVSAA